MTTKQESFLTKAAVARRNALTAIAGQNSVLLVERGQATDEMAAQFVGYDCAALQDCIAAQQAQLDKKEAQ